jgi:hypothetical protein
MEKDKLLVALGAVLVLIVPGACGMGIVGVGSFLNGIEVHHPEAVERAAPIVTLAEYEQIEQTMSYREVVDVIGDPGIAIAPSAAPEASHGDASNSRYLWRNDDASNMKATFRDDQLLTKSQMFLE